MSYDIYPLRHFEMENEDKRTRCVFQRTVESSTVSSSVRAYVKFDRSNEHARFSSIITRKPVQARETIDVREQALYTQVRMTDLLIMKKVSGVAGDVCKMPRTRSRALSLNIPAGPWSVQARRCARQVFHFNFSHSFSPHRNYLSSEFSESSISSFETSSSGFPLDSSLHRERGRR